jgi:hypothetical protein
MYAPFDMAAKALRDCDWLDRDRAVAYIRIVFGLTLAGGIAWIALSSGGLDREGKPIGTDFVGFWTASRLALDGRPDLAYDVGVHWAAQRAVFGAKLGYTGFFYPPPALLICLPLALAPYFWSLAAWLAATGYAFFRMARGFLPGLDPATFLAFPAVFINAAHGQNGFLSAALIGGGLLVMDRRPLLAGLLFGAMAYKPHLAVMLPLALALARRWRTLAAATLAAAAMCALFILAFGAPAWRGFFADSSLARAALENNLVGNEKMQSVFAAVRLLHGSLGLAWGLQAVTALGAAWALFSLQRRAFRSPGEPSAIVCCTLLATPFLLDYDLTLIAIPLAWLLREGRRSGFLPFEKALMAFAFMLPLISRLAAGMLGLSLAPITIAALLFLSMRRALIFEAGARGANSGAELTRARLSLALER